MYDEALQVETLLRIASPPDEVFEAIVDPRRMAQYFISRGSGRLDGGRPVIWRWTEAKVNLVIVPLAVERAGSIRFRWSVGGVASTVAIRLEPYGPGETLVRLTESGSSADARGIARCIDQFEGWAYVLCCLKSHVEQGVSRRRLDSRFAGAATVAGGGSCG